MPSSPVLWGVALDSNFCVVVILEYGRILCFAQRVFASNRGRMES